MTLSEYKKTLIILTKSIGKCITACNNRLIASFLLFFFFFADQSFAEVVETTSEIYRVAETNGIAVAICKAIDMGTVLMVPLFATMFVILGYGAFQGQLKWSVFVTFGIGMAAFKGAENILEFFMPNMGLKNGCKCAIQRSIRDKNGVVKTLPTGLNYDCTEGLDDYNNEH